jgi:hypothetical protein
MLRRLYREFTPEELLLVELILHVPNGHARYRSGRARGKRPRRSTLTPPMPGTSSCLSGFLIEMVDRTVSLEAPWPADDRRPLGSVVYSSRRFSDARDLRRVMRSMIADHMPATWPEDDPARFRDDVTWTWDEGVLSVASAHASHRLRGDRGLQTLARSLDPPGLAPVGLASAQSWHGWSDEQTRETLAGLYDAGLLDETAFGERESPGPDGCPAGT